MISSENNIKLLSPLIKLTVFSVPSYAKFQHSLYSFAFGRYLQALEHNNNGEICDFLRMLTLRQFQKHRKV